MIVEMLDRDRVFELRRQETWERPAAVHMEAGTVVERREDMTMDEALVVGAAVSLALTEEDQPYVGDELVEGDHVHMVFTHSTLKDIYRDRAVSIIPDHGFKEVPN